MESGSDNLFAQLHVSSLAHKSFVKKKLSTTSTNKNGLTESNDVDEGLEPNKRSRPKGQFSRHRSLDENVRIAVEKSTNGNHKEKDIVVSQKLSSSQPTSMFEILSARSQKSPKNSNSATEGFSVPKALKKTAKLKNREMKIISHPPITQHSSGFQEINLKDYDKSEPEKVELITKPGPFTLGISSRSISSDLLDYEGSLLKRQQSHNVILKEEPERIRSTKSNVSRLARRGTDGHVLQLKKEALVDDDAGPSARQRSLSEMSDRDNYYKKHIDYEFLKNRIRPKFKRHLDEAHLGIDHRRFLLRLLFFPLYYEWWEKRATKDPKKLAFLAKLYCAQVVVTIFYLVDKSEKSHTDHIQILIPYCLLAILAALFIYCVAMVPQLIYTSEENNHLSLITAERRKSTKKDKAKMTTDELVAQNKRERKSDVRSPAHSMSSHCDESGEGEGDDENSQTDSVAHRAEDSDVESMGADSPFSFEGQNPKIEPAIDQEEAEDRQVEHHEAAKLKFVHPALKRISRAYDEESEIKSIRFSGDKVQKVRLTAAQIRQDIETRIKATEPSYLYRIIGTGVAILTATLPLIARVYEKIGISIWNEVQEKGLWNLLVEVLWSISSSSVQSFFFNLRAESLGLMTPTGILYSLMTICCAVSSYHITKQFFNEMCLAEEAFWRRYLYARCFKKLTSEHKAKRAKIPYFRLTKPENIRVWLSLRNRRITLKNQYNETRDAAANFLVMLTLFSVFLVFVRLISCWDIKTEYIFSTDECINGVEDALFCVWLIGLLVFSFRFSSVFNKTVSKYNCTALLYSELVNLHMHLANKKKLPPVKVDELRSSVDIIKALQPLLKTLEPAGKDRKDQKILLHPLIYSALRIIILSALGSMSRNVLGFSVKWTKLNV